MAMVEATVSLEVMMTWAVRCIFWWWRDDVECFARAERLGESMEAEAEAEAKAAVVAATAAFCRERRW